MFYSIELQGMRFLHKHPRFDVVANLLHIESPDVPWLITSFNSRGSLRDWSVFELRKLIQNTTGYVPSSYDVPELTDMVAAIAQALPETDCDPEEVRKQSLWIKDADATPYCYVKGSVIPGIRQAGLFPLTIEYKNIAPAQYGEDPPLFHSEHREPETRERAPRRTLKQAISKRPTEGIAADIWNLLDQNPNLRNGPALQEAAKENGWQLMTAIIQLAQWKKFQEGNNGN